MNRKGYRGRNIITGPRVARRSFWERKAQRVQKNTWTGERGIGCRRGITSVKKKRRSLSGGADLTYLKVQGDVSILIDQVNRTNLRY